MGKNPRLSQAKSKNDKNISGLLNQIEAGKIDIHTFTNASAYTIAETNVRIISIEFASKEENHAQFFGQVVVDVVADTVERTAKASGTIVIPFPTTAADTGSDPPEEGTAADSTEVSVDVSLPVIWAEDGKVVCYVTFELNNAEILLHHPVETWHSGKHINHNRFLGYTKDDNGHLIIDPEQAEIVKRIYREYLEGSSMNKIADGLMADGILTGAGKTKWHTSTINKILRNEKYMGDALLQKTYTTDFLTKKRIKNNGTVPQYYVEDDHEAIIPKELFMQVQAELVRRRTVHVSPTGKKRSFSCNHCFAQMVLCGDCGELYRRVHWNNHGCKSIVWRCISRLEPISAEKSCTNRTVNELLLQEITVKAINQILTERDLFLKTLQQNIAKAVVGADTLSPDGIQARLEELQKELIKKANNKQDYDAIADEIFRLRDQKEKSELDSHHREEAMKRIKELQNFIARQETDITEFDETLVKKLIEKITVFADHFTVEFKSGITIDIEA